MSDFWQAPGNGIVINLAHVIAVDRLATGDLRVLTVLASVTFTIKAGSADERGLLAAIGDRLAAGRT